MMKLSNIIAVAAALAVAAPVLAADPIVESALSNGTVGEQWDGYLGFVAAPSADLKAAVDAINIKRRAGYTQIAAARNVTVDQFAQTTACSTLRAVKPGQAYKLKDGGWRKRQGSESITPDYCG
ncbi:YdbL family probable chaperone protein [Rhizorhabdus argentea]|uniref:YdbL family protein n=1 Tax=Rhizorhabdus argentea TaxID=1387174 RepID=UPI0030ECD557